MAIHLYGRSRSSVKCACSQREGERNYACSHTQKGRKREREKNEIESICAHRETVVRKKERKRVYVLRRRERVLCTQKKRKREYIYTQKEGGDRECVALRYIFISIKGNNYSIVCT